MQIHKHTSYNTQVYKINIIQVLRILTYCTKNGRM